MTTLIPRQHINFSEDLGIVYTEQLHIYPDQIKSLSMAKQARAVVGNTLQLVLPVRSRGNVRQYRFRFSVSEAQLPSDYAIRAMLNGEVSEGLRMEYVRKIKGDPKEIKEEQGRTIWYYGTVTDWTKIVFDDGKVVDVR